MKIPLGAFHLASLLQSFPTPPVPTVFLNSVGPLGTLSANVNFVYGDILSGMWAKMKGLFAVMMELQACCGNLNYVNVAKYVVFFIKTVPFFSLPLFFLFFLPFFLFLRSKARKSALRWCRLRGGTNPF